MMTCSVTFGIGMALSNKHGKNQNGESHLRPQIQVFTWITPPKTPAWAEKSFNKKFKGPFESSSYNHFNVKRNGTRKPQVTLSGIKWGTLYLSLNIDRRHPITLTYSPEYNKIYHSTSASMPTTRVIFYRLVFRRRMNPIYQK